MCNFRRERGSSRTKNTAPEQESVFSRRRRRIPSSSSNTSSPLTDDAIRYNLNISPPTSPTSKSSSTNEVLLASLKLPVQMVNTSAIHVDVQPTAAPLSLTSDLSDIPYIEDAETNNGYRSSAIVTPPQLTQSKSLSSMTKKTGFPLTKLKSQFKPAQLTLSAVPIDQGTKDVDKQLSSSKQSGVNINTVDPNPHSVPIMTGMYVMCIAMQLTNCTHITRPHIFGVFLFVSHSLRTTAFSTCTVSLNCFLFVSFLCCSV